MTHAETGESTEHLGIGDVVHEDARGIGTRCEMGGGGLEPLLDHVDRVTELHVRELETHAVVRFRAEHRYTHRPDVSSDEYVLVTAGVAPFALILGTGFMHVLTVAAFTP